MSTLLTTAELDTPAVDTQCPLDPDLLALLAAPDSQGRDPLRYVDGELHGAGYPVPLADGFPDFVSQAPPVKRSIDVTIPITSRPADSVLSFPEVSSDAAKNYGENRYKWPALMRQPKGWLLDAGCGFGNRKTFEDLGYRSVGIDISSEGHHCDKRGKDRPDLDLIADCHRLPLKSECFEVVNSTAVIEHLYCPPIYAGEMHRVLKPGGLFVGSCSFLEGEHLDSQYHHTSLGMYRLLEQAGFEVEHIFPGPSVWEMHSNSIYFSLPRHKTLGRWHRQLYLWLTKFKSTEAPFRRALRTAGVMCFIARKPR